MTTPTRMTEVAAGVAAEAETEAQTPRAPPLLQLMWLASPALPVGGFSYSEGLEAAVEAGFVHDAATAQAWLLDQLHLVAARGEMPLLHQALQAWQTGDDAAARACNDWVLQTRESREMRLQTEQMGRSLADWLAQRLSLDDASPNDASRLKQLTQLRAMPGGPTWPVAFALAGACAGARPDELLQTWAFGWAENQVQAAIKCVPLGQSAGQRILAALVQTIPEAVQAALQRPPHQRLAFAPGLAILSARHEQQYSRLFRS